MASGRVALTAAFRMLGHGSLIIRCVQDRRYRVAAMLGAASLAIDVAVTVSLTRPEHRPGWAAPVIDAIDTALWCRWGPPGMHTRVQAVYATAAPTAVAATYRMFAGTEAVPVYDPAEVWPPHTVKDATRKALFVAAPVVLPALAAHTSRRGRPWSAADHLALVAPGLSATVFAAFGSRYRARLHRDTRGRWWERTQIQVERERTAARANLATSSTPGHDFKKTLFALGLFGSRPAMAAAQHQAARPASVIEQSPGSTLKHALPSIKIRPLDHQRLWVADSDGQRIRRFIDETRIATSAADGADQTLLVNVPDARTITLEYLGATIQLRNEPPPLLARLYPTAPGLLISAFWKASAVLPAWRGLPPPIALGGALVDVALAVRLWRRPPDDNELRRTFVISSINSAVGLVLSGTRLCPETTASGAPALAGNSYLLGSALMIASHWSRLTRMQRSLLPCAFVLWVATGQRRRPVAVAHVLSELLIILTPAIGGWKLTERLDREATLVESILQEEFNVACDDAQHAARHEDLEVFRAQLAIARRALDDLSGSIDDGTAAQIEAECDELAAWIKSIASTAPSQTS